VSKASDEKARVEVVYPYDTPDTADLPRTAKGKQQAIEAWWAGAIAASELAAAEAEREAE